MSQRIALILSAMMTAVILAGIAVVGNAVQATTQAGVLSAPTASVVATIQVAPTDEPTPEPIEPVVTVTPEYQVSSEQAVSPAITYKAMAALSK